MYNQYSKCLALIKQAEDDRLNSASITTPEGVTVDPVNAAWTDLIPVQRAYSEDDWASLSPDAKVREFRRLSGTARQELKDSIKAKAQPVVDKAVGLWEDTKQLGRDMKSPDKWKEWGGKALETADKYKWDAAGTLGLATLLAATGEKGKRFKRFLAGTGIGIGTSLLTRLLMSAYRNRAGAQQTSTEGMKGTDELTYGSKTAPGFTGR